MNMNSYDRAQNKAGVRNVLAVLALAILAWIAWPLSVVPAGYRGVLTTLGKPSGEVYEEGVHWVIPLIQRMHLMNVRLSTSEGQGDAASKDLQSVQAKVILNYHLDPTKVAAVYREIAPTTDEVAARVIDPARPEAEGLRLQRQEVTPLLLELRKVENARQAIAKWNGQLPTTAVGSEANSLIQLR